MPPRQRAWCVRVGGKLWLSHSHRFNNLPVSRQRALLRPPPSAQRVRRDLIYTHTPICIETRALRRRKACSRRERAVFTCMHRGGEPSTPARRPSGPAACPPRAHSAGGTHLSVFDSHSPLSRETQAGQLFARRPDVRGRPALRDRSKHTKEACGACREPRNLASAENEIYGPRRPRVDPLDCSPSQV